MIKNIFFTLAALLLFWTLGIGQSPNVPYDKNYYHLIDRYEIKSDSFAASFHSAFRPLPRQAIARFADSLSNDSSNLSKADKFNLQYLLNDNWQYTGIYPKSKKPFLKHFYKTKTDFYSVSVPDFVLRVNPIVNFELFKEKGGTGYVNTRGVVIEGLIGKKVAFYSAITENQADFPEYVDAYINSRFVVPGEGFWKRFKKDGVDFLGARGYISFNAVKNIINVQFGHDKFFIGDGYRSLILSDFSNSYFFLKLNTRIWRINYTNLFTQMQADAPGTIGGSRAIAFPHKYMALHHLGINITKNFNLGFFETVIFDNVDSLKDPKFRIKYLNPIIFYRSLEHQGGSTDNALLGTNFKWNFLHHFSLYGQLVLDEFLLKEIRANDGWWGNKYGTQLGLKYIDVFGIKNLDAQAEYNAVRPFTYAHKNIYTNYAHYRQPLAHPLGANFKEAVGLLKYQILPSLTITGKAILLEAGLDSGNVNWGADVMKPYTTRARQNQQDRGHFIGQGINNKVTFLSMLFTWQPRHNVFIDFEGIVRRQDNALLGKTNNIITSVSFRWNMPKRQFEQ